MARDWIRHLPVVDSEGRLVGMVSQRDITGVFAALLRGAGVPEIDTDTLVRQAPRPPRAGRSRLSSHR